MKIASIIGSTSHVTYIARLDDADDGRDLFGSFVSVNVGNETVVGVVSDSRLTNPELFRMSPRSESEHALSDVAGELQKSRQSLIAVLLLGTMADGIARQELPRLVVPPNADVSLMDRELIRQFHTDAAGGLMLHYLSGIMTHAGGLGLPLAKYIIEQLSSDSNEAEQKRLDVLLRSITWKQTFGESRF